MTFHASVLTSQQQSLLRRLAPFATGKGFYLAGGTTIALRFGHRRSDDFDWFAQRFDAPSALVEDLRQARLSPESAAIDTGTVNARIDGVKVSFLEFRYVLLEPAATWSDYNVALASTRDLAAMKLSAIAQRGSKKDFVDVHELLRHGMSLAAMLDDYGQKFGVDAFPPLTGLAYFDDAEPEPMPLMLNGMDWVTVRTDVQRAVREVRLG